MPYCAVCGDHEGLNNRCNYCDRSHCQEHALPENHDCPGLPSNGWENYKAASQRFEDPASDPSTGETRSTQTEKSEPSEPDPERSVGNDSSTSESRSTQTETPEQSETDPERSVGDSSPPVALSDNDEQSTHSSADSDEDEGDLLERNLPAPAYRLFHAVGHGIVYGVTLGTAYSVLTLKVLFSKRVLLIFLVAVIGLGAYSATFGTGFEAIDGPVDSAIEVGGPVLANLSAQEPSTTDTSDSQVGPSNEQDAAPSSGDSTGGEQRLDEVRVQRSIHELVNEEREARGIPSLSYDEQLSEVAVSHSEDMLDRSYYSHTSPGGDGHPERYREHGYNCAGSSGENILKSWALTDVEGPDGNTVRYDSEEALAAGAVAEWMNSSGHREQILNQRFDVQGIGVAIGNDSAYGGRVVFITENFC